MPNLKPVPDSLETLKIEEDIIAKDACIHVYPYASITKGEKGDELSDMEDLKDRVCAFSDDGVGVQTEEMMLKAMMKAKELDKMIVAHCEVNELLKGGYIHDGEYAKAHGHRGICSASEYMEIARDIELSRKTGCRYHVCHISTKESVELIRKAKKEGVHITCETAPHYLLLNDSMLQEAGNWKMNPPLRSEEDRPALIEGIKDGTIDIIATDHAPHSLEEKSRGLEKSPFGITGIELAFPLLYTGLVKKGIITLDKLIDLLVVNPREIFGIPYDGFSIWNLDEEFEVKEETFLSKGKSTPFIGAKLYGVNYLTVCNNHIVYEKEEGNN
jgi:dihydroorotase